MFNYKHGCKCKPYFRTLNKLFDNDYDDIFLYNYNTSYYPIYNLHWGQVKLLYSEIEFFTKISKKTDLKNCLAVYVGAAPGDHTPILLDMFPDLNMLLYDPRKFNDILLKHPNVTIKTGNDGWFNDDKINEVKKISNNRKILYISDIRREVDEIKILEDMLNQQKWGILMSADYMLLKLRMPYLSTDELYRTDYDYSIFNKLININKSEKSNDSILYLDGIIYSQLYQKNKSTETRLYVVKKNGKYDTKYYNINKYDKTLCYYNLYIRPMMYKYKQSNDATHFILGFDNSYDSVSEYHILYKYVKNYMKKTDLHNETIKLLSNITTECNEQTGKNIFAIQLKHFFDELITINKLVKKQPNINYIVNIIDFLRDLRSYIMSLPSSFNYQIKLIKNNINQYQYINDQLKSFKKTSNDMVKIDDDELTVTKKFTDLMDTVCRELIHVHNN